MFSNELVKAPSPPQWFSTGLVLLGREATRRLALCGWGRRAAVRFPGSIPNRSTGSQPPAAAAAAEARTELLQLLQRRASTLLHERRSLSAPGPSLPGPKKERPTPASKETIWPRVWRARKVSAATSEHRCRSSSLSARLTSLTGKHVFFIIFICLHFRIKPPGLRPVLIHRRVNEGALSAPGSTSSSRGGKRNSSQHLVTKPFPPPGLPPLPQPQSRQRALPLGTARVSFCLRGSRAARALAGCSFSKPASNVLCAGRADLNPKQSLAFFKKKKQPSVLHGFQPVIFSRNPFCKVVEGYPDILPEVGGRNPSSRSLPSAHPSATCI